MGRPNYSFQKRMKELEKKKKKEAKRLRKLEKKTAEETEDTEAPPVDIDSAPEESADDTTVEPQDG